MPKPRALLELRGTFRYERFDAFGRLAVLEQTLFLIALKGDTCREPELKRSVDTANRSKLRGE